MTSDILRIGERITALPVIHGSGDCAVAVRRMMLERDYDALAVPLPPSFQEDVERAIVQLPAPSLVTQPNAPRYRTEWRPSDLETDTDDEEQRTYSYVPIDPCQPVIAALRIAMGEHIPRQFVDLETRDYEPVSAVLPDPYALRTVPLPRFAAAVLTASQPLPEGQPVARVEHMAQRLRQLEAQYESVLFVCSLIDWPWVRAAYQRMQAGEVISPSAEALVEETEVYRVEPRTLLFALGELPFVTGLYEQARVELDDDENLSLDGVKQLLLTARDTYLREYRRRARRITPSILAQCLRYIRNLSLIEKRLTPDLYTIVIAAKQVAGDAFAMHVAEVAREYPFAGAAQLDTIRLGIDRAELPGGEHVETVSRLPGVPLVWRSCQLQRRPEKTRARAVAEPLGSARPVQLSSGGRVGRELPRARDGSRQVDHWYRSGTHREVFHQLQRWARHPRDAATLV